MKQSRSLAIWIATVLVLTLLGTMCAAALNTGAPIKGDLNNNGKPDSADVRILLLHVVGDQPLDAARMKQADCNGDGRVNTLDARKIIVWAPTETSETMATTTTTTTTATRPSLDNEGYSDDVVKP